MSGFKIELGSKVKDRITGFEGTVSGRAEWLYGCRTYWVIPKELKDGKPQDSWCCDEDRIEVIVAAEPHKVKDTGGPISEPARVSR